MFKWLKRATIIAVAVVTRRGVVTVFGGTYIVYTDYSSNVVVKLMYKEL